MATSYLPIVFAFLIAFGLASALWLVATILGPKTAAGGLTLFKKRTTSEVKLAPFESGTAGTPFRRRFNVKFYLVALLFVIFDVEAVFIYPWAVIFKQLGWFGFIEMVLFLVVLTVGLIHVWRKGALKWT